MNLGRTITSYYLALGKHAALKENRFFDSYFRERPTWISLKRANVKDEMYRSWMSTSSYSGVRKNFVAYSPCSLPSVKLLLQFEMAAAKIRDLIRDLEDE